MAVGNLVIDYKLEVMKRWRGFIFCRKNTFFVKKYEMKRMAVWFLASKWRTYPLAHFFNMTNTYKELVEICVFECLNVNA